ncbi:amino acid permease, partial [Salmonella enterica subsp. enterica serovar Montevideo]|nr:amino acid permease [Salmonella enterica subsp. enterica serovar Montevideo]
MMQLQVNATEIKTVYEHVINFVVLTSAASSANSGVFSTSRMLFGLAQEGVAPKAFAKLS